jgi:hypothetical protein
MAVGKKDPDGVIKGSNLHYLLIFIAPPHLPIAAGVMD